MNAVNALQSKQQSARNIFSKASLKTNKILSFTNRTELTVINESTLASANSQHIIKKKLYM